MTRQAGVLLAGLMMAPALSGGDAVAAAPAVKVIEGPILLHSSIAGQWGGHTFDYLLEGKRGIFWSATLYRKDDPTPVAVIGQYPKPGSSLPVAVKTIRFEEPGLYNSNPPQMVRTPDGYLHIFVGVTFRGVPTLNPGRLRYYRSERPEDITSLVDRTPLIPTKPYGDFHLRMNVGLAPDGERMALVILAVSADNSVPFNTPVIFLGKRSGLDFTFEDPKQYAEAMGFFYPQVAATNDGIIIVGEMWDDPARHPARLIHLDWSGKLVHREDLPMTWDGSYLCYDMRPVGPDWGRLLLYVNKSPKDQSAVFNHELWEYDVAAKRLAMVRSVPATYQTSNPARLALFPSGECILINGPSSGQLHAWDGNLRGRREVEHQPIPGADPLLIGYQGSYYIFVPNMCYGSLPGGDEFYLACDCPNANKAATDTGPCSFLLWRMRAAAQPAQTGALHSPPMPDEAGR